MNTKLVDGIYASVVAAARQPVLYAEWGVPDTPLGRYESISLHMILFLHRTRAGDDTIKALEQDVLDEFFKDVDHSIRELGVGDQGVPKRMKKLSRMFYGRMNHYWQALDRGDRRALADALSRNVAPESPDAIDGDAIASYMVSASDALAGQPDSELLSGRISFPDAKTPIVI